ncbi:MAG: glycosyltransferase [candidate division KSB1 bacterium]|nr:glycosyltransferase [candidate division KSB1 bacterium]
MKSALKIAVAIITHNQCKNLKAAIDSIFKQSRPPDQIIILDDGSEDNTTDFLKELKKSSHKFLCKFQPHAGIGAARRAATELADADIISVLDSDDILLPQALMHYEAFFQTYPELDLAYGNVAILNRLGNVVSQNNYGTFRTNEEMKKAIFLSPKVPFKHSAIAFKKNSYLDVGGYDDNCKIKVDIDLMFRFIAHNKKIMHIDKVIAGHRIHENNVSRKRLAGLMQWYRFIFKYENDVSMRIYYLLARTFWELSKMAVERIRNFRTELNEGSKGDISCLC